MKLVLTAIRIFEDDRDKLKYWVNLYNKLNAEKPDFQKLNFSDVMRFAIELWLETKSPKSSYFPKDA